MSLSTRIQFNVVADLAKTVGLAEVVAHIQQIWTQALATGTGAQQADKIYSLKEQTIADAGTLSIDLSAALEDALGDAFTPARVKAILIYSEPTNTTNLTILGNAAAVPFLNTVATTLGLKPGGMFALMDPGATGYVVTAGTGDLVQIVNAAGAAAKVSVVIIGASV